jgi:hypothetical protein
MNNSENSENNNQGTDDAQKVITKADFEAYLKARWEEQRTARERGRDALLQQIAKGEELDEERAWDRDKEGSELKPAEAADPETHELSCFGDSKVEEPVEEPEEETEQEPDKPNPARAYKALVYKTEPFDREEREKNLALLRAEQAKENEKARLAHERAKEWKEKDRLAAEAMKAAARAARDLARERNKSKRTYGPKYRSEMSLRDAALTAKYGKFGAHPLAKAAMELWHWEPGLAASDRELARLVQVIDDLRLQQAFVRRLFRVNAGLAPQVILDRARLRQSVEETLTMALDELADAANWRETVRWLHFQAKVKFGIEYKKANRDTRKGLTTLKEQW